MDCAFGGERRRLKIRKLNEEQPERTGRNMMVEQESVAKFEEEQHSV